MDVGCSRLSVNFGLYLGFRDFLEIPFRASKFSPKPQHLSVQIMGSPTPPHAAPPPRFCLKHPKQGEPSGVAGEPICIYSVPPLKPLWQVSYLKGYDKIVFVEQGPLVASQSRQVLKELCTEASPRFIDCL